MRQRLYDSRLGIVPPEQRVSTFEMLYDIPMVDDHGNPLPWNNEGKFDKEFLHWLAKEWIDKYGGKNLHLAEGDVLAYFSNKPSRLPIRWRMYQGFMSDKFKNLAIRYQSGMELPEEEKAEMVRHKNAFKSLGGIFESSLSPETIAAANSLQLASSSDQERQILPLQLPETPKTKQLDVRGELAKLTQQLSMNKSRSKQPLTEIEDMNINLADPILRKEFASQALAKFECELNESGEPIRVLGYKNTQESKL